MIRRNACTDETNASLTLSESKRRPHPQPAHAIQAWLWFLITVMTFLLGLTGIMDSAAFESTTNPAPREVPASAPSDQLWSNDSRVCTHQFLNECWKAGR